jgi:thiol-disulfide isomerase/thioredoxin
MRRALLLPLLLLAASASAATLRDDVKQPGKIKDAFPKSAKLRVVNIWATWCVPCVAEMPELRKTAAALGSEAAFVGVSVDDTIPDAKPASVAAFLDKQKIGYTNIYYRGSVDDLTSYYRFEGEIPITLAFDRSGKEVWRHAGPIRSAEAIAELRKILRRMR